MSNKLQNTKTDVLQFVHITDTHLLNQANETFHGLNTKKNLEAVLNHCQIRYPNIDFLLFTGDISQTGDEASYTIFNSIIRQYKIPIYCIPGNHDIPKFLQHIIPSCPKETIRTIQFGKFSLILLNSWVENQHHGMISQHCLLELKSFLQKNSGQFNIIAIHHPPIIINSKWLDEIGLQNKADFLQVIHKYAPNSLLIFGHIHQEIDQQQDSLRFLSTPSTCHQYKANSECMQCIFTPPPTYRFIKLNPTHHIETNLHYIE